MLVTVIFAHQRAQPVAAEAERAAADPAGLGFAPDAPGAASGSEPGGHYDPQRAANTLGAPFNTAPGRPGDSRATRTRENAAVERRRARAPRPWGARRHTRCLRAVKARHGAATFRTSAFRRSAPSFSRGRRKKRTRRASRSPTDRPGRRSVGCLT